MLRFSYKKCCSPTVLAYQSHRNFVVSLSRLFLLGFAFFSSLCLLFQKIFPKFFVKAQDRPRKITLRCRLLRFRRRFLPFSPRIGKSRMFHVKHSAFSCFFPLFSAFCSLSFHPSFFAFSCLCVLRGVFSSFYALFWGVFCFFRFSGDF